MTALCDVFCFVDSHQDNLLPVPGFPPSPFLNERAFREGKDDHHICMRIYFYLTSYDFSKRYVYYPLGISHEYNLLPPHLKFLSTISFISPIYVISVFLCLFITPFNYDSSVFLEISLLDTLLIFLHLLICLLQQSLFSHSSFL